MYPHEYQIQTYKADFQSFRVYNTHNNSILSHMSIHFHIYY